MKAIAFAHTSDTLTFQALTALNVQRRVILTGTPIQNDLSEYFALLNFANPEYLGTKLDFRKNFESKILRGRDADATDKEKEESDAKLKELGALVSKFIIRRTNDLLSKYRMSNIALEGAKPCEVAADIISPRQIRTCRLLQTFPSPDETVQPLCHVERRSATPSWKGFTASQGHWATSETRQSPRSAESPGRSSWKRKCVAGRLSWKEQRSNSELPAFRKVHCPGTVSRA